MRHTGMLDRSTFHLTLSYPFVSMFPAVIFCFDRRSFFYLSTKKSSWDYRPKLEHSVREMAASGDYFISSSFLSWQFLLPLHLCILLIFIRLDIRWNWILQRTMSGSCACLAGKLLRLSEFCFIITAMVSLNLHLMVKSGFTIRSEFFLSFLSTLSMFFLSLFSHLFILCLQNFTQYIPLPVSELDSWLKTPAIYVFDCSAARVIVNAFAEVTNYSYCLDTSGV